MTAIYVWLDYKKPNSATCNSKIDWCGKADVEEAIEIVNKITLQQMLKKQQSKFFSHNVICEIAIQELATGKVLYRRTVGEVD